MNVPCTYFYTQTRGSRTFFYAYIRMRVQSRSAPLPCRCYFPAHSRRRTQAGASTTVVFCSNAIICHGVSRKSGTAMAVVAVAVPTPLSTQWLVHAVDWARARQVRIYPCEKDAALALNASALEEALQTLRAAFVSAG